MTENKRYFKKEYDEELYFFDSEVISEKEFEEKLDYVGYRAFEDSLTRDEILKLLNENNELKSKVNDTQVAVEIATEECMQRVFHVIDEKIEKYEGARYIPDVLRLLKKELQS